MTVSTTANKVLYTGNGVLTSFAYTFRLDNDADMAVYLDAVLQGSGYTVNRDPDNIGGTVDFSVAPAVDVVISLVRELDLTQETDYVPYDPFPAEAHEDALDKLTMISQQLQEQVSRSVIVPIDGTFTDVELPPYDAGKALMWHESNPGELDNSTDNVNGIVTAAQAAQAAAETAETNASTSASNAATSATNSDTSATESAGYRDDARLWATEAEDVPVDDGVNPPGFSAFHWAEKAAAVTLATDAVNVTYDNTTSGLTATDVQAAIDEVVSLPAGLQWSFQTGNFNTEANNGYLCDGGITVTLHAGSVGDVVALADTDGTFGSSPLTIVGNVEGDAGGLVLDLNKSYVELVYDGSTWQIANFNADFLEAKSGRKNSIINGSFKIWQRGTGGANGAYTADRWWAFSGASHGAQNNLTTAQSILTGSPYGIDIAASNQVGTTVEYPADDEYFEVAGTVTLSFYLTGATAPSVYVYHATGIGDATPLAANSGGALIPVTSTGTPAEGFTKYTYTFDVDVASTGSRKCLRLQILNNDAGTQVLAGVQLEKGSAATDFELRPVGEELALCQRYYSRKNYAAGDIISSGVVQPSTTASYCGTIEFPVEMRTDPTFTLSSASDIGMTTGGGTAALSVLNATSSTHQSRLGGAHAALTAGSAQMTYVINNTWIAFDAEL